MEDEHEPLIIDIGTGALKAGFASEHAPKHLIPMVIGKPKSPGILVGMDQKDFYIGKEAIEKKKYLNMTYPVSKGRLIDKDAVDNDLKNIIEHLMTQEMLISGEEYKCLITEPPKNSSVIREAVVEMM